MKFNPGCNCCGPCSGSAPECDGNEYSNDFNTATGAWTVNPTGNADTLTISSGHAIHTFNSTGAYPYEPWFNRSTTYVETNMRVIMEAKIHQAANSSETGIGWGGNTGFSDHTHQFHLYADWVNGSYWFTTGEVVPLNKQQVALAPADGDVLTIDATRTRLCYFVNGELIGSCTDDPYDFTGTSALFWTDEYYLRCKPINGAAGGTVIGEWDYFKIHIGNP